MKTFFVETLDSRNFEGGARQIVLEMARQDYICQGKNDYMQDVFNRIEIFTGKKIKIKSGDYNGFLNELKKIGLIKIFELRK